MPTGSDWTEWSRHVLSTLEELSKSFDKLDEKQRVQNETLIRATLSLEEHIRRTELLEAQAASLKTEVHRIEEHVTRVEGVGKFVKWISYIAGACSSIYGLLKMIGKI